MVQIIIDSIYNRLGRSHEFRLSNGTLKDWTEKIWRRLRAMSYGGLPTIERLQEKKVDYAKSLHLAIGVEIHKIGPVRARTQPCQNPGFVHYWTFGRTCWVKWSCQFSI